jgi:F0F1-type ATP synthase assembly protein I
MKKEIGSQKKKIIVKNVSLTTLGWELALPIFGGALLGYHLDKSLNTNHLLTLILLFTGIFMGYYNLIKLIELEMLRTKAAQQKKRNQEPGS